MTACMRQLLQFNSSWNAEFRLIGFLETLGKLSGCGMA